MSFGRASRIASVLAISSVFGTGVLAAVPPAITIPTTTGGGVRYPDIAYDPSTNAYLAVTGKGKVQGAWVNADGTLNGSTFNLSTSTEYQQAPGVECGTGGVCLVVWHEGSSGTTPTARVVSLAGGLLSTPVALGPKGSNWEMTPGVAYSPTADLFAITWMGDFSSATNPNNIWLALVNSSGALVYSGRVTTGSGYEREPTVGYNPTTNEFVVLYCGVVVGDAYAFVRAQRVDMTGASIGAAVQLDQAAAAFIASIAYNTLTQSMLATWNRGSTRIYGRQFNGDGTFGSLLTVTSTYGAYDALDSAYNTISKSFLIVTHASGVEDEALEVSSGLVTLRTFVLTNNGGTGNYNPRVATSTADTAWMSDTARSFATLLGQTATSTADAGNDVGPPPPPPCTVQTTGTTSANGLGDAGSITVTIPSPPCSWTAVTNAPTWLHVSPITSGTDSDTVSWTALENTTGIARVGTITINSNIISITQGVANHPLQFDATLGGDFFGYKPTSGAWTERLYNGSPFLTKASGTWATGWQILPARFNTDGFVDLFDYNPITGAWRKALNQGNGTFAIYTPANMEKGWTPVVLDLNGDGLSDVLLYNQATGAWKRGIASSGATNFTYVTGNWAPGWQVFRADFNGDGDDDLFLYNQTSGTWAKAITQPDSSFTLVGGDTTWEAGWQIYPGDFDGDGITDLFAYRTSDGHAMRVTFTVSSATYVTNDLDPGWTIRQGDLNKDGKTDLLLYNPANGGWAVESANGAGWFDEYIGPSGVGTGWDFRVAYLDTDGSNDVLWYMPSTGQTRVWLIQNAADHTEIAGPTLATNLQLVTDDPAAVTNPGVMPYPIPTCDTATSPTASTAGGFGGTGTITITAGLPTCSWTAVSNAVWLDVSAPSGIGPDSVTWTAAANTTGSARVATVTIAGMITTITQKPEGNPLQLDGTSGGDFFTYKSSTGAWASKLYDGSPFTTGGSGTWATGWQVYSARFNTDGLADFFLYNPSSGLWRKALNTGGGTFSIYFPPSGLGTGYSVTLFDSNGDGLTDVFLYNPTTGAWKRGIATAGATNFTYTTGTWATGWQVFRANSNNDGLDDLFLYRPSGVGAGAWQRALTQPNGTFAIVNGDTTWEAGWSVFPGDFDGDGVTDLFLYRGSDGHAQRVTFTLNSATYQTGTWPAGLTIRTGDLSADGKTDVLGYNGADGSWLTATSNLAGWFDVYNSLVLQNIGTGWVPYVEYFDTDVAADVLWYNPTTGATMEWITLSPSVFTSTAGPTLPTGLSLVADPQ